MDKNPPASVGDSCSIPGPERFHMLWSNLAHVPQLLKPEYLEPAFHNKGSHSKEKPKHCNQRKSAQSSEDPVQQK